MINQVIEKTVEVLRRAEVLSDVREWRCINGLVPSKRREISVGCDELRYEEYSQSLDECQATLKIYASLENRELPALGRKDAEDRLEYGERAIRELAENIRAILVQNYTLDGLIDVSAVEQVEFVTAEEHADLHIAVLSLTVKYYAERQPERVGPTVKEIYMQMNEETMHSGEKEAD